MGKILSAAVSKPKGENVYTVISDVDIESALKEVSDSESETKNTTELQKEAEALFSSISRDLPERLIGLPPGQPGQ